MGGQHTPKCQKKFCFYTEIFYIQKSENESLYLTYLWVLETEIQMEMDAAIKMEQEKQEVWEWFKGRLLLMLSQWILWGNLQDLEKYVKHGIDSYLEID